VDEGPALPASFTEKKSFAECREMRTQRVGATIMLAVGLVLMLAAIAYLSRNTTDRKFFEHFNAVRGPVGGGSNERREGFEMEATVLTQQGMDIVCENNPHLCFDGLFRVLNPVTGSYTSLPLKDGTNELSGNTTVDGSLTVKGDKDGTNVLSGDTHVDGSLQVQDGITFLKPNFNTSHILAAGSDGDYNGVTHQKDTVITNVTQDIGFSADSRVNGITLAPWNTKGGLRVHGAGVTVAGDIDTNGSLEVRDGITFLKPNFNTTRILAAGSDGDYNGVTHQKDTVITNVTQDIGFSADKRVNGITLAPWNTKGGLRVHGAGVTVAGDIDSKGSLQVSGDWISFQRPQHETRLLAAGDDNWYNRIARKGDTLITNITTDGRDLQPDSQMNGITLAPWNTKGGLRVHGAGATINGQLKVVPGGDLGNLPDRWGGGVHTWDVYANGTVGVGQNGQVASSMDSLGQIKAAQSVCIGGTCITEGQLKRLLTL
jgi:hypothetical protein